MCYFLLRQQCILLLAQYFPQIRIKYFIKLYIFRTFHIVFIALTFRAGTCVIKEKYLEF